MRTTGGKSQAPRRSARWHVKKHDDTLIERWARACSREHGDCRGCEFIENCQDLADRLIGCMGVPLTGQCRHPGTSQMVPSAAVGPIDPLRVRAAVLR